MPQAADALYTESGEARVLVFPLSAADAVDAVVVGAGPNGLAAAITLAQAGRSVRVIEAHETIGGGTRTAELTLPGFRHDVCSAIHPALAASPFFRSLELDLDLIEPPAAVAHPLDDGTAVLVRRSVDETAAQLGRDAAAYRDSSDPLVSRWNNLEHELFGPIVHMPRHPLSLARFARAGLRSAKSIADMRFETEAGRALFAGAAAHSFLPLEQRASASFGLVLLLLAHVSGWPFPRGGSQAIADALAARLRSLGGEIETDNHVSSLSELPSSKLVLCDVTPKQLLALAGDDCRTGTAAGSSAGGTGRAHSSSTTRWTDRSPGGHPRSHEAGTVHIGGITGGDRGLGACGLGRKAPRAAFRPARAAESLRRNARSVRQTHRVGLLPCPERIDVRHARACRGSDRALRARLPRACPRMRDTHDRRPRARQPQPRRGRHLRGCEHTPATPCPAGPPSGAPTPLRCPGSTSARRPLPRVQAYTGCAAT